MARVLTRKDIESETWARLSAHLRAELEAARTQLESKQISAETTASLRGDISRIRSLLALALPDPAAAPGSRAGGNREDEEGDEP